MLPIDALLPDIVASLRDHPSLVLHAPTGAGKTTRVPPALLASGLIEGTILVLEPRRVAARAAALRMAAERREPVGETIGYQVRFDRVAGPKTRVLVVTEGVLLQRLVSDPFLDGVGAVIFDEVHERSLDADLAMAITASLQRELRPELRLVAMSATIDTDSFAGFLNAPVLRSDGRAFPVDIRYLPRPDDRPIPIKAADHARTLFHQTSGDMLVFLPGAGEIARTAGALSDLDADVLPLHGRLEPADQDRVLTPGPRRRVILATNVAETSLTIPGVTVVLDVGQVRVMRHDPRRGLDRLVLEPNSQASADQRAGRAGRTAPGTCLRLWTELQHRQRPAHDTPEVRRVDLCGSALALMAWGEPDPRRFGWLEAPTPHALDAALDLLDRLGATEGGRLTDLGRAMASLPAHPRIGRLLVEAHRRGVIGKAALAAAILEEREPFVRDLPPAHRSDSDLLDLLDALEGARGQGWRPRHPGVVHQVRTAARQLADRARKALGPSPRTGDDEDLLRALAVAWPDRIGARRAPGDPRLALANGRGAVLGRDSAVHDPQILVALDVTDTDDAEARVSLASRVDAAWLPTERVATATFDAENDRVLTAVELRFGALVLERRLGAAVPNAVVEAALIEGASSRIERAMPDDADLTRLLVRMRYLHRARPDAPPGDKAFVISLLPELVAGRRSLADLRKARWTEAAVGRLSWPERQELDRIAPERISVPSGSNIRVDYPDEGPPVLAVRMQEMFGCTETPRIAGLQVMLHLLAPNGRPQQITQDLAGFWERTWPEVRKELRVRYPKHAWPDDPRHAPPQRKGRPPNE